MIVNVYGTKDILYETGIGGYRDELYGFTPKGVLGEDGETKKLINIEIIGADHFNYMRDASQPDQAWNLEVSNFVTGIMANSSSTKQLEDFLLSNQYVSPPLISGGKWVVNLPGYEQYV